MLPCCLGINAIQIMLALMLPDATISSRKEGVGQGVSGKRFDGAGKEGVARG